MTIIVAMDEDMTEKPHATPRSAGTPGPDDARKWSPAVLRGDLKAIKTPDVTSMGAAKLIQMAGVKTPEYAQHNDPESLKAALKNPRGYTLLHSAATSAEKRQHLDIRVYISPERVEIRGESLIAGLQRITQGMSRDQRRETVAREMTRLAAQVQLAQEAAKARSTVIDLGRGIAPSLRNAIYELSPETHAAAIAEKHARAALKDFHKAVAAGLERYDDILLGRTPIDEIAEEVITSPVATGDGELSVAIAQEKFTGHGTPHNQTSLFDFEPYSGEIYDLEEGSADGQPAAAIFADAAVANVSPSQPGPGGGRRQNGASLLGVVRRAAILLVFFMIKNNTAFAPSLQASQQVKTIDAVSTSVTLPQNEENTRTQEISRIKPHAFALYSDLSSIFAPKVSTYELSVENFLPSTAKGGRKNSVIYIDENGNKTVRTGGTRSWRNNNPGNLRYTKYSRSLGAIGKAGGFAVFPDYETGINAMASLLKSKNYEHLSLAQAIARYAPYHENDTDQYIATVSRESGVPTSKIMSSCSDKELRKILISMIQMEGWREGKSELVQADPVIRASLVLKRI